jgi:hypothetical protein
MELDGYSDILKLAFEHHGIQHYQFVPRFHRVIDTFNRQRKKDRHRKMICKEMGIELIIIPTSVSQKSEEHLKQFISSHIPNRVPLTGTVNFDNFYILSALESLQQVAKSRGGKCFYDGPHHKVKWECHS